MKPAAGSSKSLKEYMVEGDKLFSVLSAEESPVRHMSEANRDNEAQDYSAERFLSAIDADIDLAVKDFKNLATRFGNSS